MNRAIIFDRDGTLIRDAGYIKNFKSVVFYNIDFDLMKLLNSSFLFFIVSNQSGIGKGLITADDVVNVNNHIVKYFEDHGICFSDVFYCPHNDSDFCGCRKPHRYFLDIISQKFNVDLSKSFVIGDHPSDIVFAERGGTIGIYLLSGHGRRHFDDMRNLCMRDFLVKNNLNAALKYIASIK